MFSFRCCYSNYNSWVSVVQALYCGLHKFFIVGMMGSPGAEAPGYCFLVELSLAPGDRPLVLFENIYPWFSMVAAIGADASKLMEEGAEGILVHAIDVAQIVGNVPEFCGCAGSEEPIERSV